MSGSQPHDGAAPAAAHGTHTTVPGVDHGAGTEHDEEHGHFHESAKLFEQPLLAAIAAVALVFGFIGYRQYFRQIKAPSGWVDVLYADLQLVKMTSKVTTGTPPWTLNVGRLLAPIVTAYAALRGVLALHRERLDRIRVARWRGHTVIVGASIAGTAVARVLRREGRRVVMIDADLGPERVASLRSIGVFTVVGDAHRVEVLRQANAMAASDVLALSDDDALNIDVVLRTGASARSMAAVSRADLCELLRIEALGAKGAATLDFLNAYELTARTIDARLRHGLIGGDGDLLISAPAPLAAQLLARAARASRAHVDGPMPTVRVVGADAQAAIHLALLRVPALHERLRVVSFDEPFDRDGAATIEGMGSTTRAVVAGDGVESIAIALALARRLPAGAEVALAVPDPVHLRPLLAAGAATRAVPILVVDVTSWWTDPELVLGGTVEVLARATHANYVAERLSGGASATGDASLVAWASLDEHLKASNRDQARHIWTKLATIGCALAPASGAGTAFSFRPDEVELLARMEHDRWVAERRNDGWTPGPRDPAAKRSPYLVGWSELTEDVRDLDRIAITGMPSFLADVGYEIVRVNNNKNNNNNTNNSNGKSNTPTATPDSRTP